MSTYSLKSILSTFTKPNGTKRTIFNLAPVGGISSKALVAFFISLPFIEYAVIFNPFVFDKLGIAQAIVFFIVFLVMLMQAVFVMIWRNNKKVKKKIAESWKSYFDDVDLEMLLSSGRTPYSDYFKLSSTIDRELDEEALHKALKALFVKIQEDNSELLAAMKKDRNS